MLIIASVILACTASFFVGHCVGRCSRRVRQEVTGYIVHKVEREDDPADYWKKGGDDE